MTVVFKTLAHEKWWTKKSPSYPYQATSLFGQAPAPSLLEREGGFTPCISVGTMEGRIWGFETQAIRNRFVAKGYGEPV